MSAWTDAEEQDARAADDARMREWAAEHPDPRTALAQAQAEVERLTRLLGSHADGHRCTCTMTAPIDYVAMTPAEWEEDPWCPTHPDVDYIRAEYDVLRERLYQVEAECDSNVAAGRLHAMNMMLLQEGGRLGCCGNHGPYRGACPDCTTILRGES